MAFNSLRIDDFKGNLIGGGARANLFGVVMNNPYGGGAGTGFTEGDGYMVKAASLPGSIITPITVPFRGRQLQVAGDRTFEPWVVTVINDHKIGGRETIRDKFERWMNSIASHVNGTTLSTNYQTPSNYMADMEVSQLDKAGNVSMTYYMRGVWPSSVSAIDLSYDSENTIEEFSVEFQITYWTNGNTDQAGR